MAKSYIPKVSEEEIISRFHSIKPLVRKKDTLYNIESVDLFKTSFIWDPKLASEAPPLKEVKDITTYHTYGYYGFFKPSIAEVLAQIPSDLLDKVSFFEIIGSPQNADDLNDNLKVLNDGYHVATTRLYEIA